MPILLIEDNRIVARIVRRFLEDHRFPVVHMPSAEAAFVEVYQRPYDLLVVDWVLPGVSGIEFARHLRAHPMYANVPIIMLTHRDRDVDVLEAMEARVNAYVRKPPSGWKPNHTHTLLQKVTHLYDGDRLPARPLPLES